MRRTFVRVFAVLALLSCSAPASALILAASNGVNETILFDNVTIGNAIEIDYEWLTAFPGSDGINNPVFFWQLRFPGSFLGQDDSNSLSGEPPTSVTLNTMSEAGTVRTIALGINLFNDIEAFARIRITDVRVDGRSLIPAPAAVFLMGLGLAGFAVARRRRRV